jgi:uncharacterized membrane protein YoaK (UPF0700 family)
VNPRTRKRIAAAHLWVSIIAGVACTVFLTDDPYERVLIAISFYAITITAADAWLTADVRTEQEDQ